MRHLKFDINEYTYSHRFTNLYSLSNRRDPTDMKTRYTLLKNFLFIILRREIAMRYILRTSFLIIILSLLLTSISFAAGDVVAGKVKAETCLGCHGVPSYTNVYPTYHVPDLGGQYAEYIAIALKAYQTGERSHPTMQAHAAGLSDKDMADIGAYFQSLQ